MKAYLPKILITGCDGQLGTALQNDIGQNNYDIIAASRSTMDITDMVSITDAIAHFTPDIIINTAAYTAVDKAESAEVECMRINHVGAQNIAIACQTNKIPLIHVSTDYVFDGSKHQPIAEDEIANPINIYGKSKWLGEEAIRKHTEEYIILRVSGVFSEYGNNFLKTMLRLAAERDELSLVSDQITCPTYAGNIAKVIYSLAKNLDKWGTYHYCDSPPVSWYEFANSIINTAKQHTALRVQNVKPIKASEYVTAAKRPAYSVLECSKINIDYGISQADWMDSVNTLVRNELAKRIAS